MAEEGSHKREEGLKHQLDQLRVELGQERSARKQLHHDKVSLMHTARMVCSLRTAVVHVLQVRDVKAAKEKQQAVAKEQIESLKLKLQREKNQELQVSGSLGSRCCQCCTSSRFCGSLCGTA